MFCRIETHGGAKNMRRMMVTIGAILVAFGIGYVLAGRQAAVIGQNLPGAGFAAIPQEKGGFDLTGPYTPDANWPKPMSTLPGHDAWTWGSMEGVFAESPNRVFLFQRGELP